MSHSDDAGPRRPEGFVTFTRAEWSALGGPASERHLEVPAAGPGDDTADGAADSAAGPGDDSVAGSVGEGAGAVPVDELDTIYRPLCRLLSEAASGSQARARRIAGFLGSEVPASPFVVGIAGSVAAGKSTVARVLQSLLAAARGPTPVAILSTDSFLYPNAELAARGLGARKGFPESYDLQRLLAALGDVRAGAADVEVPVYSHREYDIVPGHTQRIRRPSVLLVEGLNVLQPGPRRAGSHDAATTPEGGLVSDFLDWSIYIDAAPDDLARWHCERLLALRSSGRSGAGGFLGWFCALSDAEAEAVARASWTEVNAVNLRDHIAPSRARARTILHKGPDHRVSHVFVRAY